MAIDRHFSTKASSARTQRSKMRRSSRSLRAQSGSWSSWPAGRHRSIGDELGCRRQLPGAVPDRQHGLPTGTVAHLLLRRDDALYVYDIFCPLFPIAGYGQARLEPEPGSFAYDAFGPEISGQNYPASLTCNVTIERRADGL